MSTKFIGPNIVTLGDVPKRERRFQPTDTQLTPSLLFNYFSSGKEPACLSNDDPRMDEPCNLYYKNMMKYGSAIVEIDKAVISEMVDACVSFSRTVDPLHTRILLSDEEVVNGFGYVPRMDPHTSAGHPWYYPWMSCGKKGKTAYMSFDEQSGLWQVEDIIWKAFKDREIQALKGERVQSVWTASLKDECVKTAKVKSGRTRVFIGPPMDFTMLTRKYFGAFISWCVKNAIVLGLAAGINPESLAWDQIYQRLNMMGCGLAADMDYKFYDMTIQAQLIRAFIDFVNQWYNDGPDNARARETIGDELIRTVILVLGTLFLKLKGNPSGNPLTMIMNSWIGIFLLMLFYFYSVDVKYRSMSLFFKYVSYCVMGDDNIFSVSPLVLDQQRFADSVAFVLGQLGMEATSGNKQGGVTFKHVSKLSFLQREFAFDHGVALPVLNIVSIQCMLQWNTISKFMTKLESTEVNVDTAMRYLFFHGRDIYNYYRSYILRASALEGLTLIIPEYEHYLRVWLETNELDVTSRYTTKPPAMAQNYEYKINMQSQSEANEATAFEASNGMDSVTTVPNAVVVPTATMMNDSTGSMHTDQDAHGHHLSDEKKSGIIFDEQTEESAVRYPFITKAGAVCEEEWNMKNFFMIPVRIASGTWSTTNTAGTILKSFINPYVWSGLDRWSTVFNRYMYFRCRIVYRIELNGTPFHAGKLVMYNLPLNNDISLAQAFIPEHAIALPHVTLYPAYNNVAELETQWLAPTEYLPTDDTGISNEDLFTLPFSQTRLGVMNQLSVGTGGSTSLNYTVYAYMKDVELAIPKALTGSAQGLFSYTNIVNQIQNMENSTLPQNVTGDAYDLSVGLTGLDVPADTMMPNQIVRREVSANHPARGHPSLVRTSLFPESQSLASQYNFEVPYDEMSFKYLCSRWNFIQTTSLSTTQAFGTVLAAIPIAPIYRRPQGQFNATPIELLVNMFDYWRGDVEFCVEIVSTQYHTAKLFLGVSYSNTPVTNFSATGIDPLTYYGKTVEVNKAKTCFEVTAPYQYPIPWCRTKRYPYNTQSNTVNLGTVTPNGAAGVYPYTYPSASIGNFFIAVLNPLVIPSNIATSIDINIYMRPGKNFMFHTPGPNSAYWAPSAQVMEDFQRLSIRSQGGDGKAKSADKVGKCETSALPMGRSNLNERVRSLRDVLKRYVYATSGAMFPLPSISNAVSLQGCCAVVDLYQLAASSANIAILSAAYRAMMGDLRIKVVANFIGVTNYASPIHCLYVPPSYYRWPTGPNSPTYAWLGSLIASYCSSSTVANPTNVGPGAMLLPIRAENTALATSTPGANIIGYPNATNPNTNYTTPTLGITGLTSELITPTAPALELEIPFYSPSRFTRTLTSYPDSTAIRVPKENPWGYLVFWCPANAVPVPSTSQTITPLLSFYVAAGDNFRLAQYTAPRHYPIAGNPIERLGGTRFMVNEPSIYPSSGP